MEKEPKKTEQLADNENLVNEIKWHGNIKTGVRILNQNCKGYNDEYECMRILKGTFNVYCEILASVLQKPLFKCRVENIGTLVSTSFSATNPTAVTHKVLNYLNVLTKRRWNGNDIFGLHREDVQKTLKSGPSQVLPAE